MLRAVVKRTLSQAQEAPAALLFQTRNYVGPLSLEFTEDVSGASKGRSVAAPPVLNQWAATKAATEDALKLLKAYKDIGDAKNEPYLKFHNPRTFEDLDAPVPNFKKFALKAGEVPKFFDNVLTKRADDAAAKKTAWWEERRALAKQAAANTTGALPSLAVPSWQYGRPVSMNEFQRVADVYYKSLEPSRKLKLPTLPASVSDALSAHAKSLGQEAGLAEMKANMLRTLAERAVVEENGKALPGFTYLSKAEASARLLARRQEVHAKWVKAWAKKIMVNPEQALVPLKERTALLASRHADCSTKYADVMARVVAGPQAFGERLAESRELDNFFMRREKDAIKAEYPVTDKEAEGMALAAKLEDRGYALERLLGPAARAPGDGHLTASAEVAALTEHLHAPDRVAYKEGMKLAARLAAEEEAMKAQLAPVYGADVDIKAFQAKPRSVVTALFDRLRQAEAKVPALRAAAAAAPDAYTAYDLKKQADALADPSNLVFDEVLHPAIAQEAFDIEMAELDEWERSIEEGEEEEAWLLALAASARHTQKHLHFDLPMAASAHMDPLLYKKLDWEYTHGQDLLHSQIEGGADCEQGVYMRDLYGLEHLSHHLLPLIRYRRKKFRATLGYFPPELSSIPATSAPAK